jgi:hypothetical protein
VYCGGPARPGLRGKRLAKVRARCREILLSTLREAVAAAGKRFGADDPARWQVPATCPKKDPPMCDQKVPTVLGAVSTPPFPWQNRGTFHQVVEVAGHR